MKIQAPAREKNQLHFPKITVLRGRSGIFNLNFPGGPFAPGADTIFCPRLGDEIAVIQRLASCGPRPSAPRHSHPHRPCPSSAATPGSQTPPAPASPGVGCHGSAHTAWRSKSISALAPQALSARAALSIGRNRRRYCPADSALPAAASSALRPQHRLRPPEPRLAPSQTDIRAPGAAGRAAHPWSSGSGAARRPRALSGPQRPRGASAPPAAGSPLAVRPDFGGDASAARLPSRCPSSSVPPRRRRGGTARLFLRAARSAAAASSLAGFKRALRRPPRSGWDLGVPQP